MQVREMFEIEHYEKQKRKRNVCAYARVSTTKDLQYTSYEYQVKTYTEMITANEDWNFIGVYADEGKSGTNITYRDNFQLMIQLAMSGFIDLIITKSISRFARNVVDCLTVVNELKKHNVEVYFETDDISSFDPKIDFVISLLASMAEEESKNTSENVKWNVRSKFSEGKFHVVSKRLMGYDNAPDCSLVINEEESQLIKRIFDEYTKGVKVATICRQLNEEGIKTKYKAKKWYSGAIMNIIKNEKYTGNALLQKTIRPRMGIRNNIKKQQDLPMYYVENSHPGIISLEQFELAQKIRLSRMEKYHETTDDSELKIKYSARSDYAGMITCGTCGKSYRYKRNNIGTPYERTFLKCASNKSKKTCTNHNMFCETFDKVVLNQINLIMSNKTKFINGLQEAFSKHFEITITTNELNATQAKISGIKEKMSSFEASNDEFELETLNELELTLKVHERKAIELENKLITTLSVNNRIKLIKAP